MPDRRCAVAAVTLVLGIGLTGCRADFTPPDVDTAPVAVVTPSGPWRGTTSPDEASTRLRELVRGVEALRADTRSSWVGHQDDISGYLGELSGGTYGPAESGPAKVVDTFLAEHGKTLFGVAPEELRRTPGATPLGAATVVRADQVLRGVPVVDGRLMFTLTDGGRLTSVRGRSFGGLDVDTTPRLSAARAVSAATANDRRAVQGAPVLRVVPEAAGELTWRVTVVARGDAADSAWVYVSAVDGHVVRRDPLSASARPQRAPARLGMLAPTGLARTAVPRGTPTPVSGKDPYGEPVSATGLSTADGVALVDTTLSWFDRASGRGAIETYDMGGSNDQSKFPGRLVTSPSATIADPEAVTAHSLARSVMDTYSELWGWKSWDGKGGTLRSTVNVGEEGCNAYFRWTEGLMIFTDPCRGPQGDEPQVEIDTTGHEITHGVTGSSAGLRYTDQSGALNEAFSDYFGNVIGNRRKGSDNSSLFEDSCKRFTAPHTSCQLKAADGKYAVREMLNGTTYPDLLRIVGDDLRITELAGRFGDNGGVHGNSAIWNNALWTIRTQLAKIDGKSGNDSPRATAFDALVFGTLTTQLTPTSDMVQASRAVLDAIQQAGTDPVIARVARETFAAMDFCDDCLDTTRVVGERLTRTPGGELNPVIAGDHTAWIQGQPTGRLVVADAHGAQPQVVSSGEVWSAAAAGDAVVYVDIEAEAVVRRDATGRQTQLARLTDRDSALIGVAGSAEGAAWLSLRNRTMSYVDAAGRVTTESIPDLGGDQILSISAGGGSVAFGGKRGGLYLWQPNTGPTGFSRVGGVPGTALTVAVHGDHVYGADLSGNGVLMRAGQREPVQTFSGADAYHGAAMSADSLVWSRFGDDFDNKVLQANATQLSDVDLHLFSLRTRKRYSLVTNNGWQAFPTLSGSTLAWVDASHGNSEILLDHIPEGL